MDTPYEIYYKGLSQVILKIKSQDLIWQARNTGELVVSFQYRSRGLITRKTNGKFQSERKSKGKGKTGVNLQTGRERQFFLTSFYSIQAFNEQSLSTVGRAICFIQPIDSRLISLQKPLTNTPRIMFNRISGHPTEQSN